MKQLALWKINFDSSLFGYVDFTNENALYEKRENAECIVEKLKEHLERNYLKRMGRKVLHIKKIDVCAGTTIRKYGYCYVVIDKYDYPTIVKFGCERTTIYYK